MYTVCHKSRFLNVNSRQLDLMWSKIPSCVKFFSRKSNSTIINVHSFVMK